MGAVASSCVRDCVRSSHEYAGEGADGVNHKELLRVSVEPSGLASGSRDDGRGAAVGATTCGVVPPVPNWFQVLQTGRREPPAETPRFDEVLQPTPRPPGETPREAIGGEFRTPRPGLRDSPRSEGGTEGNTASTTDEVSYEGTYLGTMKHGRGTLRMTTSTYVGEFESNKKHGEGTLTWDDGRRYKGGFQDDKFHGHALMTWPDGRKYVGAYADDRKHGEGTFSWQDGRRYQGQWLCGKRHGVGIYTNAKGVTRRGTWQMDRPLHWESPGAELLPLNPGAAAAGAASQPGAWSARAGEPAHHDPVRLEVAVAHAAAQNLKSRRLPLQSPREMPEEPEADLEVKVAPVAEACKV